MLVNEKSFDAASETRNSNYAVWILYMLFGFSFAFINPFFHIFNRKKLIQFHLTIRFLISIFLPLNLELQKRQKGTEKKLSNILIMLTFYWNIRKVYKKVKNIKLHYTVLEKVRHCCRWECKLSFSKENKKWRKESTKKLQY